MNCKFHNKSGSLHLFPCKNKIVKITNVLASTVTKVKIIIQLVVRVVITAYKHTCTNYNELSCLISHIRCTKKV